VIVYIFIAYSGMLIRCNPTLSTNRSGVSLVSFTPVSVDDVVSAICRLPDKSSAADPLPVSVMKLVSEEIAPFLTKLFNRSMSAGHFPVAFKDAFITPALKKPGLDVVPPNFQFTSGVEAA